MLVWFIRSFLILDLLLPRVWADTGAQATAVAPGYGDLGYILPEVGSYRLPPLGIGS